MSTDVILMFSGQGSQYPKMGWDLYRNDSVFRDCLEQLDEVATRQIGESVISVMYGRNDRFNDAKKFSRMLFTHPALFMVQYSLAKSILASGLKPGFVLGVSLGEFVAAAVAGVATPERMLRAVIDQAQAVERTCKPGGMLAIVASPQLYYDTPVAHNNSDLVSINYARHFVVSGEDSAIENLEAYLKQKEITCHRLDVSYGFHSHAVDPVLTQANGSIINQEDYLKPSIPLLSCCEGGPLAQLHKDHFWRVLRRPIKFSETIAWVEKTPEQRLYLDLGVAPTLSKFVSENLGQLSSSSCSSIINPIGNDYENLQTVERCLSTKQEFRRAV